jgi:hypothetical protein
VYEASFDFPGIYSWNGCKNSGELLPMGVYAFIPEIKDEDPMRGSITIIR